MNIAAVIGIVGALLQLTHRIIRLLGRRTTTEPSQ